MADGNLGRQIATLATTEFNLKRRTDFGQGESMQRIDFKFWRATHEHDWSVEVNGNLYEAVPADLVKQLVQHALIDAEESVGTATIH